VGFDMRFVQPASTLPDWYEPIEPDDPAYYQLTFGGMSEVAAAMAVAGLLDGEAVAPELPDWPPPGLSPERAEQLQYYLFDADKWKQVAKPKERPIVADFLKRFSEATGRRSESPGLVPAYKFQSNDGWLVLPEECCVIADGLEAALNKRRAELVRGLRKLGYSRTKETVADLLVWWAQYNRVAADHGGYRVW
jgi:hypothetical protein